jgi:hypothetical protein
VDGAVRAIAFVVNAVDGVKRAFQIAGSGIVISILGWKGVALEAARAVVEAYDSLPFTERSAELQSITAAIAQNNAAIAEGTAEVRRLLLEPLAGNALVEEFEKAKVAAQEAAEATVAARAERRNSAPANQPAGQDTGTLTSGAAISPDDEFLQDQETFEVSLQEREDAFKTHKENMVAIEQATNGQLSDAARNLVGEQSGIFKALFAIEKGAAIARSIVAIQAALAKRQRLAHSLQTLLLLRLSLLLLLGSYLPLALPQYRGRRMTE